MSMTNVNPKNDALLAFEILINSQPGEEVSKKWLKEKLQVLCKTEEPYKMLTGSDYTAYMTRKDQPQYKRGE